MKNIWPEDKCKALRFAIRSKNNINKVKEVLENFEGYDIDGAIGEGGYTALMQACCLNETEIVQLLIESGDDVCGSSSSSCSSPLSNQRLINQRC